MAISMSVTIDDKRAKKLIKKLSTVDDLSTPMKQSGIYLERSIARRFSKADWKPLSPATIKIHPRRKGGKPLNDTGKLRMSVTSQAIVHVEKMKLTYGTNLVYAPLHNFGGKGGWGRTIPQREFLYFDDKDAKAIKRIFTDYVKELAD